MPHRIKLMWDYGCWPLWQNDGQVFANVDSASLPISAPTLARLQAWAAIPDAKLAEVEYPPDMKWSADERRVFETEGRDLWRTLRRELGHDYHVVYRCTTERRILSPEDETVA